MPTVLIAEDDIFIGFILEDFLIAGGYEVCGISRTVDEAVALGDLHKPDLAVFDFRLANGGYGSEIRPRLVNRCPKLGILYATGDQSQVLTKADGEAYIGKPYYARYAPVLEHRRADHNRPPRLQRFIPAWLPSAGLCRRAPSGMRTAHTIVRLLRQQAALANFGSFAFQETDLPTILSEAARICAESLGVPYSKICRYRPLQNDLLVVAGYGWEPDVIGHVVSQADESSTQGRAFVTGEPVILEDIRKNNSYNLPPFYARHGIISTVDVLIKSKSGSYGVLEVDSSSQRTFDEHDINFLTGFANVVAEAVGTSERVATLQATLAQMESLIEDKQTLLNEKEVLAAELQHRVRNNLQFV